MKQRLQGMIFAVLIWALLTGGIVFAKQIEEAVKVVYDNIKISIDGKDYVAKDVDGNIVEPFIYNGTTYLPVRGIAGAFNKDVSWDEKTNTVIINSYEVCLEDVETPVINVGEPNYEGDLENKNPKTLDEAMSFYLKEKAVNMYGKGDFFATSYRILDTAELQENGVIIYAHILCERVNSDGEVVSGGSGVVGVTFKKDNDIYEYEKFDLYDFPQESDIPQKVKNALLEDSYFTEMRSEVDKDITDFLKANQ